MQLSVAKKQQPMNKELTVLCTFVYLDTDIIYFNCVRLHVINT